jgi:hypothetical protein
MRSADSAGSATTVLSVALARPPARTGAAFRSRYAGYRVVDYFESTSDASGYQTCPHSGCLHSRW